MKPVESRRLQRNRARAGPASASARLFLPFLIVLILLHALPLHAQIEWTPEEQISIDDVYDDWFPRIAAGPDGRVWVVWRGSDGYDPEIMYSVNDGSGWSYPDRVNTDDYAEDSLPDIAVGLDGNPWVVWGKRVGGHSKLYWSRWEGDGWRPEERVFPDSANEPYVGAIHLTVAEQGVPWIVLPWYVAGGRAVCTSRCVDDQWAWPDTVVNLPGQAECRMAAGTGDDLWVVIRNVVNDVPRVLYTYREGGAWASIDTIPGVVEMPRSVTVTPDGEVWISWHSQGVVWAAVNSGYEWAPPEVIAAPDSGATGIGHMRACCPDLAVSPVGLVWTTWREYFFGVGESNPIVYASRRGSSGWTPKEQVSGAYGFVEGFCQIALNSSGVAWIVWQGWDGRDYEIVGSHTTGVTANETAMGRGRPVLRWRPNPMRTSAILQGNILGATGRPILIYDTSGRLVRRIDGRALTNDGGVQVSWDSRGSDGHLVPTGTYIWRTQAGGDRHEGVVVVIR